MKTYKERMREQRKKQLAAGKRCYIIDPDASDKKAAWREMQQRNWKITKQQRDPRKEILVAKLIAEPIRSLIYLTKISK